LTIGLPLFLFLSPQYYYRVMKGKPILEIDILRAISALAVITIHVTGGFIIIPETNLLKIALVYIQSFSQFAVSCFLFISGLVLYENYKNNDINFNLWRFYSKRFSKILPIYLLFSLFYIVFSFFIEFKKTGVFHIDILVIIYKLLTGGAYYHLWYFGLLFQFYLLFPLLLKLYKKYNFRFLITGLILQLFWIYASKGINDYLFHNAEGPSQTPLFLSHLFYFIFGFYFSRYKNEIISSRYTNFALVTLMILILNMFRIVPVFNGSTIDIYVNTHRLYFYIRSIIDPLFYLLEILLFYKLSLFIMNKNNCLTISSIKIGNYSLEIYLVHIIVLIALTTLLKKININYLDGLFYPVIWIFTVIISYAFAVVYKKITSFLSLRK
jgi:peptidoglycan/LPS O-acetylase OafA/YrhL